MNRVLRVQTGAANGITPATRSRRKASARRRRIVGPTVLAALIMLAACSDRMPVTEPAAPGDALAGLSAQRGAQLDAHPGEQQFRTISSVVPSFGGYFFDEGANLVAYVVDPDEEAAARVALEPILRNRRVSAHQAAPAEAQVAIRQGRYSFVQLQDWRDRAGDEVLALGDAVWIDLDEAQNRLAIGLETGSGRAEVEGRLADLTIPLEAVIFEVTGGIVLEKTLRDSVRPLIGGLQINMRSQGGATFGPCTFGFNARKDGVDVFVTASHCSEVQWSYDGTNFYQPFDGSPTYWIGQEYYDPPSFRCGFLFWRKDCRYSDATIVRHQTTDFELGVIARTTYWAAGRSGVGSVEIDPSRPPLGIIAEDPYPAVGDVVDKIGRTTGWTYGVVEKSCTHWVVGGTKSLCQGFATYGSGGGDSGAPVFIMLGNRWANEVALQGIHVGHSANLEYAVFSPMGGIERDLGGLITFPSEPPPLSASISGPSEVRPGAYCTWWATVTGGEPPYTYQWSGVLSGTGSEVSGTLYNSGPLYLDVTDGSGETDGDQLYITVSPSVPECLM